MELDTWKRECSMCDTNVWHSVVVTIFAKSLNIFYNTETIFRSSVVFQECSWCGKRTKNVSLHWVQDRCFTNTTLSVIYRPIYAKYFLEMHNNNYWWQIMEINDSHINRFCKHLRPYLVTYAQEVMFWPFFFVCLSVSRNTKLKTDMLKTIFFI